MHGTEEPRDVCARRGTISGASPAASGSPASFGRRADAAPGLDPAPGRSPAQCSVQRRTRAGDAGGELDRARVVGVDDRPVVRCLEGDDAALGLE